jgi:predicted Zn-dependent protease
VKRIAAAVFVLAALVVGAVLLARHERYEWTTDSAAALAAFEAGQEALGKLYAQDAVRHFERAVAADPDFAAARLYLLLALNRHEAEPQRIKELLESLEEVEPSSLTERERALISIYLARAGGERDEAAAILDAYLAEHPDDPYLLDLRCMQLVTAGPAREDEAEQCLRRLIELDPNRVAAQNLLGYSAMNRGDFARAEEQFEIYRFLAPDQANPHDSLGELLMVTGRYDGAEEEFRRALAIKPDFCPTWQNLVRIELLRGGTEAARAVVDELRAAGGCPESVLDRLTCDTVLWPLAAERRWEEVWRQVWTCDGPGAVPEAPPEPQGGEPALPEELPRDDRLVFTVMAALQTGRTGIAEAVRDRVAADTGLEAAEDYSTRGALAEHLAGLVATGTGDPGRGVEHLRAADARTVWGGGMGLFKLFNRLQLAGMLAQAGDEAAAQRQIDALAAVNRPFASAPPLPPLHPVPAPSPPSGGAAAPVAAPPPGGAR